MSYAAVLSLSRRGCGGSRGRTRGHKARG